MATPTWYLGMAPQQEPFDVGLDEAGRAQCVFNILAQKRPSASFISEIIAILVAAGIGTEGANIFGASDAVIPPGPGPYLSVRPTGGIAPAGTHNDGVGAYRRPGIQVLVRASTWRAADAMAQAAYDALAAVRNQHVAVSA